MIQLRYQEVEAPADNAPKFPVFPGCQIGFNCQYVLEVACLFRVIQIVESALTIIGIGRAGGD